MKDRIKRSLALCLALLLFAGTLFTDNLFVTKAEGDEAPPAVEQPAPAPEQPAPAPEQPAVQPEQPAVQPEQPAATPEQQSAEQEQPVVTPEQQSAEQEQPATDPAVTQEAPLLQPEVPASAEPTKNVFTVSVEDWSKAPGYVNGVDLAPIITITAENGTLLKSEKVNKGYKTTVESESSKIKVELTSENYTVETGENPNGLNYSVRAAKLTPKYAISGIRANDEENPQPFMVGQERTYTAVLTNPAWNDYAKLEWNVNNDKLKSNAKLNKKDTPKNSYTVKAVKEAMPANVDQANGQAFVVTVTSKDLENVKSEKGIAVHKNEQSVAFVEPITKEGNKLAAKVKVTSGEKPRAGVEVKLHVVKVADNAVRDEKVKTDKNGEADFSNIVFANQKDNDTYKYSASVEEDLEFKANTTSELDYVVNKPQAKFTLTETKNSVSYGDKVVVANVATTCTDTTPVFVATADDVNKGSVEVADGKVIFTANIVGNVTISVYQKGDDLYNPSEVKEVKFQVQKKKISAIENVKTGEAGEDGQPTGEKVYDAKSDNVVVTGTVKGIHGEDLAVKTEAGTMADANVGNDKAVSAKLSSFDFSDESSKADLNEKYELDNTIDVNATVTVTQRPLDVVVYDGTREWNQTEIADIKFSVKGGITVTGFADGESEEDAVVNTPEIILDPNVTYDYTVVNKEGYKDAITIAYKEGDFNSNYKLGEVTNGNLKVVPESMTDENIDSYLTLKNDNVIVKDENTYYYDNDNSADKDSIINFEKIKEPYKYVYINGDQKTQMTIAELKSYLGENADGTVEVYLGDEAASNSETGKRTADFKLNFKEDKLVNNSFASEFTQTAYKDMYFGKAELEAEKGKLVLKTTYKKRFGKVTYDITKDTDKTSTTDVNTKAEMSKVSEISFTGDGNYTVVASIENGSGGIKQLFKKEFVIDTVSPVVSIKYYKDNTEIRVGTKPYYINAEKDPKGTGFAVEVNVNDANIDLKQKPYSVKENESMPVVGLVVTDDNNNKAKAKGSYVYETEGKYTFEPNMDYKDLAGNPISFAQDDPYKEKSQVVFIDRVAPTGTISVKANGKEANWSELLKEVTFGLYGNHGNTTLSVIKNDPEPGSGIKSVDYATHVTNKNSLEFIDPKNISEWNDKLPTWNEKQNENVVVYARIEDEAGNVTYLSSDNITMDNIAPGPSVSITPSKPGWGKDIYRAEDKPAFVINTTDNQNVHSGIRYVYYEVQAKGVTTFKGTVEHKELTPNATDTISVPTDFYYSNDIKVTVKAEDWSGNVGSEATTTLSIDNRAPVVKFSFDKSDAHNVKYYKNNKTLTITVDERNFDKSYLPKVTSTAGGGWSFSGWSQSGTDQYRGTVTFSGDSDYTVTYDCYDLAGNKSNTEKLEEFTVDKTQPKISVTYDNNNAQNGNYYKAARTATITITEHNFRASDVRVSTTASAGGAPGVSGWSSSGDRHTATVHFNKDAIFTFDIDYTDLAGNVASDYAQDRFVVDLTKPKVEITGVKDKSANKGDVIPVITVGDTNFLPSGVTVTLTGANKGKMNVDSMFTRSNRGDGQVLTFKNFGKGMDDIYTLTAKSRDKAGNETTSKIRFSVNRDGSTYKFSKATADLLKKGITNNPETLVIDEINVDTLKTYEISYTKDGQVVNLKKGVDYEVNEAGGDGQWKQYTYTINASNFEAEGNYIINIISEDAAENTNSNKIKSKGIEFIVDKTAPKMVISNLEDLGRYKEDLHQFTLDVKDNVLLSRVVLFLDGKEFHTYTGDELNVENGKIVIDVNSKNAFQNVKLVAYDEAGNESAAAEYNVLVTASNWVQFYMNKPLFFGTIAGILAVAGLIVFFILWKRKKDEEEQNAKVRK